MRAVIQRVKHASVSVDNQITGEIKQGFLVLLGVTHTDTEKEVDWLAKKITDLRVFNDSDDKMNLGLKDVDGELLIISQFTLYGNCIKGRRPAFIDAAKPDIANELYEKFLKKCKDLGFKTEAGIFGADMKVELLNDGPVTLIIDTKDCSK
ncbi:MAG: D-aminoacyl-tRNA deacylase [Cetobacterium sp.]|uniref:D-aminoacyl-tRNA deacylase n=1 Tax=Cetobacterium TaxID=180162 RepID=UPI001F05B5EA|nr:D-aminoacyl-tRNA deacylase [Cetobacterium somerae]MCX3066135.1 D-aminoacyl-tRNA deacylase [Cetobacterium somerae]UPO96618.1 D-aminoacyl-tRNA deacylase [Cetobacterium somerae]